MKGRVLLNARIAKLRERLTKHRLKIAELEAQTAEMEQEIKRAEEEQLGYLARSAANNLTGGMDEVFELLRGLQSKTYTSNAASANPKPEPQNNLDEYKEGETVDGTNETDITDET